METKNYTTYKRINIALLVIAILWVFLMAVVGYIFLNARIGNLPTSAFLMGLVVVLVGPILEIIALLVSLISITKDRPWGYMTTGIVSGYILYNSLMTILKIQAGVNLVTIVSFLFWITLTVISFYMYIQAKQSH